RLSPVIRMRTLLNPRNEMHYAQTRAQALEILFERSDVPHDEEARDELLKLKLGEWCRFDDPERDRGRRRPGRPGVRGGRSAAGSACPSTPVITPCTAAARSPPDAGSKPPELSPWRAAR